MINLEDKTLVLAGDIGGTKTNLGIFLRGKKRPAQKVIETYPSIEAPNLEHIIERFFEKNRISVTSACFGIAGPVVNGRCTTTNLPWDASEVRIKRRFKWKHVRLINDLTATAGAVSLLNSREFLPLNRANVRKGQNIALLAPGTGFGNALLVFQKRHYVPIPSEGGHADFSPNNETQIKLWQYLHKLYGHVSVERVLSGPGLLNIYSWVKESTRYKEPAWLSQSMKEMDPSRAITEAAMNDKNPLCVKTLDIFVSIFGAVAGNLALTGMTTGGVYLGGGISPKILSVLKNGPFMRAFTNKGRFKGFLEKVPVRVVLNDRAALLGAAYCALENINTAHSNKITDH